jgi:hypothetical protein
MCRGNVRVLSLLQQVRVVQRWTWGLGGDLGASPLKSHRGLRIIGLDADPCIVVLVLYHFHYVFKTQTLYYVELYCNLRTYCNNSLLFGLCICDVLLCNYYICNDVLWWSLRRVGCYTIESCWWYRCWVNIDRGMMPNHGVTSISCQTESQSSRCSHGRWSLSSVCDASCVASCDASGASRQ